MAYNVSELARDDLMIALTENSLDKEARDRVQSRRDAYRQAFLCQEISAARRPSYRSMQEEMILFNTRDTFLQNQHGITEPKHLVHSS
jgi:hypothetical protein